MGNRQATEAFIIKYIEKITGSAENVATYKKLFGNMSEKDFASFMTDLESGKRFLVIIEPNFSNSKISVTNNFKVAEELGHDFFQRLWIEGKGDKPTYLTPNKYLVVDLPLRRASQLLIKKISVPKHNKIIDSLTGQPTGDSKGGRISYPELQICAAMGLDNSMVELMKYRGGDARGGAALSGMLSKLGSANLATLKQYASGVESTYTLKTYLTCLHLRSNL
jgi:hypothetical protein